MRKGELLVASPTVMEGYWKLDDLTANVMMVSGDGQRFYQTGDLVTEDDYGRLIFLGRKDRLLKVRGYRLQPEEIEHVLQGHADVIEAAVVVIREAGLESIAGVVATTNFEDGFQKHLKKLCEDILPPYMVPSKIVRVEALPRGNRGKIDFRAIENIISLQPDAQRDGCG
jgi:acyl-coenzyme A synthetase/AMP-(fatty) acid ligase